MKLVTRIVGGRPYSLRPSPAAPWAATLGRAAIQLLAVPVMIPAGLGLSVLMATPLRDAILGFAIPRIMDQVEKEFREERRTLLSEGDGREDAGGSDKGIRGRVLDVGSGAGAYLKYCGPAADVVALEPNERLHPKILESGRHLSSLAIVRDFDDVEGMDDPPSSGFDWVIFGNVLCEVEDVEETVRRVDGILKPGGRVYFSEHVGRPRGTWRRTIQDAINPLWRHVGGGCNCNRDSIDVLRSSTDWDVAAWTYEHMQVGMGPFVLGLAAKPTVPDGTNKGNEA